MHFDFVDMPSRAGKDVPLGVFKGQKKNVSPYGMVIAL